MRFPYRNPLEREWFLPLRAVPEDAKRHRALIEYAFVRGVLFFHIKDVASGLYHSSRAHDGSVSYPPFRWWLVDKAFRMTGLIGAEESIPQENRYEGFYIRADAAQALIRYVVMISRGDTIAARMRFRDFFKGLVEELSGSSDEQKLRRQN